MFWENLGKNWYKPFHFNFSTLLISVTIHFFHAMQKIWETICLLTISISI